MRPLRHAFLIRRPDAVGASYVVRRPEVSAADLGFLQQLALLEWVRDTLGQPVVVIDSDDVLRDPLAMLDALCEALDVPFHPSMLAWPAGHRASDGVWAPHWYDQVQQSTGFKPFVEREVVVPAGYEGLVEQVMPAYEAMRAVRLRRREGHCQGL
jgi:hypothetical protein